MGVLEVMLLVYYQFVFIPVPWDPLLYVSLRISLPLLSRHLSMGCRSTQYQGSEPMLDLETAFFTECLQLGKTSI